MYSTFICKVSYMTFLKLVIYWYSAVKCAYTCLNLWVLSQCSDLVGFSHAVEKNLDKKAT